MVRSLRIFRSIGSAGRMFTQSKIDVQVIPPRIKHEATVIMFHGSGNFAVFSKHFKKYLLIKTKSHLFQVTVPTILNIAF